MIKLSQIAYKRNEAGQVISVKKVTPQGLCSISKVEQLYLVAMARDLVDLMNQFKKELLGSVHIASCEQWQNMMFLQEQVGSITEPLSCILFCQTCEQNIEATSFDEGKTFYCDVCNEVVASNLKGRPAVKLTVRPTDILKEPSE